MVFSWRKSHQPMETKRQLAGKRCLVPVPLNIPLNDRRNMFTKVSLILWFGWARHFLLFSIAACWGKGTPYYLKKEYLRYRRTQLFIVLQRINLGFLE